MYDGSCGVSAAFSAQFHREALAKGKAGPIRPADNIGIDLANGTSMGYLDNSWIERTYTKGGVKITVRHVGAVCENYHKRLILGNVAMEQIKCKMINYENKTLQSTTPQPLTFKFANTTKPSTP